MALREHRTIRVALRIADRPLRARIVRACEEADIAVADPDETPDDADIVLADHPVETAAPVIALGQEYDAGRDSWRADIRARVPADVDAATLAAVIAVVAAGLVVMPHQDRAGDEMAGEEIPGAEIPASWAETLDGAGADELPALTAREREVLALLAEGASNKAIARALAVSVHTAKFHVASLTDKLGASGRLEAITIAIRAGLVMV